MRAILTTTIQLDDAGLISVPVQLVNATDKGADISFNMADSNGGPVKQQYVDANGMVVARADMTKTFEGTMIPAESIKAIDESTKIKTLKVEQLVDATGFPFDRVEGRYFIQANPKIGNPKAFKLLVEALDGSVAVTKVTIRSRQQLLALFVQDGVMMGATMLFADELAKPDTAVEAHKAEEVSEAEVTMAKQLLEMKRGTGFLDNAKDEGLAQRRTLVDEAVAGKPITAPVEVEDEAPADDLMAALEASLKAQGAEVTA